MDSSSPSSSSSSVLNWVPRPARGVGLGRFMAQLNKRLCNSPKVMPSFRIAAMKTLLIYDELVTLNRDQHRQLKLAPTEAKFAFARGTNSVHLAATELPLAALDFPCVFIGGSDGHSLAAIVGLRDNENLFVQTDGTWAG